MAIRHASKCFKILRLESNFYDRVMIHLRENFYVREPLLKARHAQGLLDEKDLTELDQKMAAFMQSGSNNLVAVTSDYEKVVGVKFNVWTNRDEMSENCIEHSDGKTSTSTDLVNDLFNTVNLYERVGVDRILNMKVLSVDMKYQGFGIGRNLVIESENLGYDVGAELLRVDCTSPITAKIYESLGWDTAEVLYYKDYIGLDGKPIFNTGSPNDKLQVMYKVIKKEEAQRVRGTVALSG